MAGRIDESRRFQPVHIAVLTVSDTRGEAEDTSGRTLIELITRDGHKLVERAIVRDDRAAITATVRAWIADPQVEAVISTGGTGVTGRDITPEAFEALFEKKIDGFGELFRALSYQEIGSAAMLTRATAGVARGTAIFILPGAESAVRLGMTKLILPELGHVVRELKR
ncbi:MAG TPA: molybdenum cofactor synthesis domain-containing protein [Dongiaceae bacterium]